MTEPDVEALLVATFTGESLERARQLMAAFEKGAVANAQGETRIPYAVIKIANGDADVLAEATQHAERDWRDTLMWADFGEPEAHLAWARRVLAHTSGA